MIFRDFHILALGKYEIRTNTLRFDSKHIYNRIVGYYFFRRSIHSLEKCSLLLLLTINGVAEKYNLFTSCVVRPSRRQTCFECKLIVSPFCFLCKPTLTADERPTNSDSKE